MHFCSSAYDFTRSPLSAHTHRSTITQTNQLQKNTRPRMPYTHVYAYRKNSVTCIRLSANTLRLAAAQKAHSKYRARRVWLIYRWHTCNRARARSRIFPIYRRSIYVATRTLNALSGRALRVCEHSSASEREKDEAEKRTFASAPNTRARACVYVCRGIGGA